MIFMKYFFRIVQHLGLESRMKVMFGFCSVTSMFPVNEIFVMSCQLIQTWDISKISTNLNFYMEKRLNSHPDLPMPVPHLIWKKKSLTSVNYCLRVA